MDQLIDGIPYCAVAIAEEDSTTREWGFMSELSSKMSIRHSARQDFCAVKQFM